MPPTSAAASTTMIIRVACLLPRRRLRKAISAPGGCCIKASNLNDEKSLRKHYSLRSRALVACCGGRPAWSTARVTSTATLRTSSLRGSWVRILVRNRAEFPPPALHVELQSRRPIVGLAIILGRRFAGRGRKSLCIDPRGQNIWSRSIQSYSSPSSLPQPYRRPGSSPSSHRYKPVLFLCHVSASMPPTTPRIAPEKNPPIPNRLTSEKTRIITLHVGVLLGLV